ncbi:MAG: zinc ribbon domain-containing protein [Candidatus Gastranaerophilaceae bacterium]|jgi:hypothetical protein
MKCPNCLRELHPDSRYCDWCGTKIEEPVKAQKTFNTELLIFGIVFSVVITFIVTKIAGIAGIPLIFGGLFLPFFWKNSNGKKRG